MSNQDKVLTLAKTQLGIKESVKGRNIQIETYHRFATVKNDKGSDQSIPWCSSFMCWCFESAGLLSTNSRAARSWLKYGKETKEPKIGDVVVLWREARDSEKGHVGLFMGFNKNKDILILGGNQSDEVNVRSYKSERLLGFRTY